MADKPGDGAAGPLPPKLDLRKRGIVTTSSEPTVTPSGPGPQPGAPAQEAVPAQPTAPAQPAAPTLRPMAQPSNEATIRIKPPAASPDGEAKTIVRPIAVPVAPAGVKPAQPAGAGVSPRPNLMAKKSTSRIPLESAAPVDRPRATSTIRIKPAVSTASVPVPKLGSITPRAPQGGLAPESKRKTSRIPLESALAMTDQSPAEGEGDATPKTIRLKRPSEAATIKVAQPRQAMESPGDDAPETLAKPPMGKTARIEEPPEEEGATPTRRKTIVVKRPPVRPELTGPTSPTSGTPTLVTASAPAAALAPVIASASAQGFGPVPVAEKTGWMFPVLAAVAMLVACLGIYIQAAQVFSAPYGTSALDLPWVGKVSLE